MDDDAVPWIIVAVIIWIIIICIQKRRGWRGCSEGQDVVQANQAVLRVDLNSDVKGLYLRGREGRVWAKPRVLWIAIDRELAC